MSERYLYSVHPRRAIKNLSDTVPVIRSNKTLSLTLEEVLTCLKSGVVYRRFANEGKIERVTIANVERLHNAKYMTEAEYKEYIMKESEKATEEEKKETVVVEEKKDEAVVTSESIPVADSEIKVESAVITLTEEEKKEAMEEVVIEESVITIANDDKKETTMVMEKEETSKAAVTGTVTDYSNSVNLPPQSNNGKNNYGGKNKNHR